MEDYSARLTGEPFLYNETKILARYLADGEDAESLRKRNLEENLIMHKTNTKINKAAIIIIYHHGINFVTLPKVKTRW